MMESASRVTGPRNRLRTQILPWETPLVGDGGGDGDDDQRSEGSCDTASPLGEARAPPLPASSAGRDVSTLLSHGRPEWQRPRVEGALQAPLTAGGHCGDPSHGRAAVGLSPVGGHPRVGTPLLAAVSPRRLRSGKRSASLG